MSEKSYNKVLDRLEERFFIGSIVRFFRTSMGILIAFLILVAFLSITADNFFGVSNLMNVLRNISTNAFLAMGVMMCLSVGGIDLTGGAMLALSGCVCVVGMERWGISMPVAILLALLVGLVAGFANGTIIAYSGIHPFIVTLAMQSICRGAAYLICNGQPVTLYRNNNFSQIGNGKLWDIPLPAVYMIVALILIALFLNKTKMGRHVFAVGGNAVSARYSGINVKVVKQVVWTLSGTLAAIGGIILAARMTSGQPATGISYETDAIAASVVGGTSMYGGVGTVGGMVIGILIIGIISNGLNLLHINSYWQYVIKGLIILAAVWIDMIRKKREENKKTV